MNPKKELLWGLWVASIESQDGPLGFRDVSVVVGKHVIMPPLRHWTNKPVTEITTYPIFGGSLLL